MPTRPTPEEISTETLSFHSDAPTVHRVMTPLNKFRWILVASGAAIGCAASSADRPAAEAKPAPPPAVAPAPAAASPAPATRPAGPGGVIAYFLGKPFQVRSVLLFPE